MSKNNLRMDEFIYVYAHRRTNSIKIERILKQGQNVQIFFPEEAEEENRKWGKAMNSQSLLLITYFHQ